MLLKLHLSLLSNITVAILDRQWQLLKEELSTWIKSVNMPVDRK
ncbi:hypothetical protein [Bacillus norwichensis]|nr:hypothetical protein [Bacillus norwichensis]